MEEELEAWWMKDEEEDEKDCSLKMRRGFEWTGHFFSCFLGYAIVLLRTRKFVPAGYRTGPRGEIQWTFSAPEPPLKIIRNCLYTPRGELL